MQTTTIRHLSHTLLSGAMLLSLVSCINDNYIDDLAYTDGKVAVELSIQTRSIGNISSTDTTYVEGTQWENYVDFNGGDYRIYFFEYNPTSESTEGENSKLIAEFEPKDIFSTDLDTYTRYTLSGELDEGTVANLENFKVVVVANWGVNNYPTVSTSTTIDDICNAQTAVFNAFVDATSTTPAALMPSSSLHIPFFGLREYSGVSWREGTMTRLSGDITLLRSVAKVEVIVDADSEVDSFDNVSIVNYNAQGYCAPTGVYLRSDYDHNYTWSQDFTESIHIASGGNDTTTKTMGMQKTAATASTQETWTCYLTEYDNTSTGAVYSYISVTINEVPYKIYFGNYDENGQCAAYDADGNEEDRFDVYRNYLYRYHVKVAQNTVIYVYVEPWKVLDEEQIDM